MNGIDDGALEELIVESQDLHADALGDVKATLPELAEIRKSRLGRPVDVDRVQAFNDGRRSLLRNGGMGLGALGARGLLGGGIGGALLGLVSRPASAQAPLDLQILQTAASLENLAVATYEAALGLPFFDQNATMVAFAMTTRDQHAEHGAAFNAQVETLGGQPQNGVNPVYAARVEEAKPGLTDYSTVVDLAATLEQVATETYVSNVSALQDSTAKEIMASIMGVEAQHLATLRAVGALLDADALQLVTVQETDGPVDVSALPAAAGSVAFPEPFLTPDPANVAPPESGAVQ